MSMFKDMTNYGLTLQRAACVECTEQSPCSRHKGSAAPIAPMAIDPKIDTRGLNEAQCKQVLAAIQQARELGYRDGHRDARNGKAAPLLNKIGVYTAAIIKDAQGRYFIQQNRKRNQWVFPGGKPEPGENTFECLVRECREELGIEITKAKYKETHCTEFEGMDWIGVFFEVEEYAGTIQNLEPEKHAGHVWLPPQFFKGYNLAAPEAGMICMASKLYAEWLAAQ